MANLEFLASIKEAAGFTLELWFVMQAANYREIPDFAKLGKHLGVDLVLFTRIRDWGTFSDFSKHDIFHPQHPQHQDFMSIMQDPILNDPVVCVRNNLTEGDDD